MMQEHGRRPSENSLQRLTSFSEDASPRSYSMAGVLRNLSSNGRDISGQSEALLKAQVFELRRDLASAQQASQNAQQDLQRKQSLIRAAAGEARKEVLSLRNETEQLSYELSSAHQEIKKLEQEVQELHIKLAEGSIQEDSNEEIQSLQAKLNLAESESEELKSSERISNATKQALRAQISELVLQLDNYKNQIGDLQTQHALKKSTDENLGRDSEEFQALQKSHHEAMTQLELLQNELKVALEEGSQDRISAAAKILELECKLAHSSSPESPVKGYGNEDQIESPSRSPGLKALLSPNKERVQHSPNRGFSKKLLLDSYTNGHTSLDDSKLPKHSSILGLVTELHTVSSYVQDISTRLQDSSLDFGPFGDSEGDLQTGFQNDIAILRQALEILEQKGKAKSRSHSSDTEAESVHAITSKGFGEKIEQKSPRGLSGKLVGGIILAPALIVAALFLPMRKRIQG